MVLTVTLNPLLERVFFFKKIKCNSVNRNGKFEYNLGGKGINVSNQLNILNIDNFTYTFIGGQEGKIFKSLCSEKKIKLNSVNTKSPLRNACVVVEEENSKVTTYIAGNSDISKTEADEFLKKLDKMIQNCEMVVFAGSSPNEFTDQIFPEAIKLANKYDKISVCDTYGNHLKNCFESSPTIVHNNLKELESSLNINLNTEQDKLNFMNELNSKGIKQVFITDGANDIYASNFSYYYKTSPPKINLKNETGSGDCFVAGLIYGWVNNLTFEEIFQFATAFGSANASSFQVCSVCFDDVLKLLEKITILPIGKKIKTIYADP